MNVSSEAFYLRTCNSIRGFVGPSVRWSVRPSHSSWKRKKNAYLGCCSWYFLCVNVLERGLGWGWGLDAPAHLSATTPRRLLPNVLRSVFGQQPIKADDLYHIKLPQWPQICSLKPYGNSPIMSYKTSILCGCCPAHTPLQLITTNRAMGTAEHVISLDHLFSLAMCTILI